MSQNDERVVGQTAQDDDSGELSLRPRRLAEYIGQQRVKESLHVLVRAALQRAEPLDHVLLYGPPGLGKTTLAAIIAAEMGASLRTTSGPAFERQGDLVAVLTNLQQGDVLFVDEIHRLNRLIEEILYPAMEDFAVDFIIGKGPSARALRMSLPHFTIIGATTRLGLLSHPLRDRFGVHYNLEFYTPEELVQIITRSAILFAVPITPEAAHEIACRSRGTPRVANRLLRRVRDYVQVKADGVITLPLARSALAQLDVDDLGLDRADRRLLETMIHKFDGGPVGVETLAAATSDERDTIEDVYEPFLLQLGFLKRTPRGRVATRLAYAHLGVPLPAALEPETAQPTLFDAPSPDGAR